uniref:Uncharacterized protein n=1 Tax=Anguilla anguilla TaxID=7936 RepID=A0A0E9W2D3_ANGAN
MSSPAHWAQLVTCFASSFNNGLFCESDNVQFLKTFIAVP